jgi:glycosyltransferase involved in cell wall biosynthesis
VIADRGSSAYLKVLHVLYQSLPSAKGSCIRSRDILAAQRANGIEVIAITSPFQAPAEPGSSEDVIEGVSYLRTGVNENAGSVDERVGSIPGQIRKLTRLFAFTREVQDAARRHQVDILHAHGTFFCGLAALRAGRALHLPVVYEVRSLWEERVRYQYGGFGRVLERLTRWGIRSAETYCTKHADAVVVIGEGLKTEFQNRGVASSKIVVVPNAMTDLVVPDDGMSWLRKSPGDLVLGYVGHLSPIEGLDVLLGAVSLLRANGLENRVLVFGDGIELKRLSELVERQGISNVEFKGVIPAEKIAAAYGQIDIAVLPRRSSRLTEMVTPLKPLECLAYGKLTLLSDIGGHRELLGEITPDLFFESDSVESLFVRLSEVLVNNTLDAYGALVANARRLVYQQRNWASNARVYSDLYRRLVEANRG